MKLGKKQFQALPRMSLALLLAAAGVIGSASASKAASATLDFYEGNDARQNLVCSVAASRGLNVNFKNDNLGCDNDEARSLVLYDVPAGWSILLFDSPTGDRQDDWTEIRVKTTRDRFVVGSFENSVNSPFVRIIHHRNNGLDGKVSRLEVR